MSFKKTLFTPGDGRPGQPAGHTFPTSDEIVNVWYGWTLGGDSNWWHKVLKW